LTKLQGTVGPWWRYVLLSVIPVSIVSTAVANVICKQPNWTELTSFCTNAECFNLHMRPTRFRCLRWRPRI